MAGPSPDLQPTATGVPGRGCSPSAGAWLLLVAGLAFLLIFRLGQRGLNEPDEGRYANIALSVAEPWGQWWNPRMSGFGHYDKPPLVYWVTSAAFRLFGQGETAARLPSLAGALMALAGLAWAAGRLYGAKTAWWAVLICGTLGQFWLLARFLTPDMLLTGACTLAVAAWLEARHRDGHWGFWGLGVGCWTLAWWVKATPALVPLAGLAMGLWLTGDRRGRTACRLPLALLCILVLGSPWFLWMLAVRPELSDFFFHRELAGRVTGHADGRAGPVYYHLALLPLLWFPWLPALGAMVCLRGRARLKGPWRGWLRRLGLEGWMVAVGLAVFSGISSKLPTYTLPLAPWGALVLARVAVRLGAVLEPRPARRGAAAVALVVAGLYVSAAILAPRYEAGLGLNSSLRLVSLRLRQEGAQVVFLDRHWPGMEFYFGHQVHYVTARRPQQLASDAGYCPVLGTSHFCPPERWRQRLERCRTPGVWVVHYARQRESPFAKLLEQTPAARQLRVGDYVLAKVR